MHGAAPQGRVSVPTRVATRRRLVSNTLQVLYVDEPRVIEVFPDRGLSTGGYALFVEGTNFWNTSSIFCDLDEAP